MIIVKIFKRRIDEIILLAKKLNNTYNFNIVEVKKVNIEYKEAQAKDLNKIDHIIAVMSGK